MGITVALFPLTMCMSWDLSGDFRMVALSASHGEARMLSDKIHSGDSANRYRMSLKGEVLVLHLEGAVI